MPRYIEERICRNPLPGVSIIRGSTPVISFGNVHKARIATLGWNPSKLEFLDRDDKELIGDERRLETLNSLRENDLEHVSEKSIHRIFEACNSYFRRRPYRWFNSLEKVLQQIGASYYDESACHLDLVQWATNPVWGKLANVQQTTLLRSDLPFVAHQLSQENLEVLLLNGRGIVTAYQELFHGKLNESSFADNSRLRIFSGRDARGFMVIGWNINLQSSFGVSNSEVDGIAVAINGVLDMTASRWQGRRIAAPQRKWWRFWPK